jgi:hypothetical protein
VSDARRFFHWELEFPEVFFDEGGRRLAAPGFHVVIGNPPWDMVRTDAGAASGERGQASSSTSAIVRFSRDSGVYTAQSDGHANMYHLFVDRAMTLTRPGGRLGLVLPSGVITDRGSARLRRRLFSECSVDAIVGLDNRDRVFPIHRSVSFVLLTATCGVTTNETRCRLGSSLSAIGEKGRNGLDAQVVRLTPGLLERLSGPDFSVPWVRSPMDLAVLEKAATLFPSLGSTEGWGARFGRELNATDDRAVIRGSGNGHPVIGGRHIAPFRVTLEEPHGVISSRAADRLLGARHRRSRLAYRDVASATNRTTLIAAILPPGCVSTHTVFCLRTALSLRDQHYLCGLLNSFVLNFLARLRVTTHVTTAIVERLPLPPPAFSSADETAIADLAERLARHDDPVARASLNARVAKLYQLTRPELEHVLGTFVLVAQSDRDAVLTAFNGWRHESSWK